MYPKVKRQLLNNANKITYPTTAVVSAPWEILQKVAPKKWKNGRTEIHMQLMKSSKQEQGLILFGIVFQKLGFFLNFQSQAHWTLATHMNNQSIMHPCPGPHNGVTPVAAEAMNVGSKQGWRSHSGWIFSVAVQSKMINQFYRQENRRHLPKWKNILMGVI